MKYENLISVTILTALLLAHGVWGEAPAVPGSEISPSPQNWELVTTRPSGLPYDADFQRGLLNVKKYDPPGSVGPAKGNGYTDDTASIQAALYTAYEYQLVCYFPTGTYEISDTLDCLQAEDNHRRYTYTLLGEKGNPVSNRPVIRIKSGTGSFGYSGSPKPMLKIWAKNRRNLDPTKWSEEAGDCFNNSLRGIDFDLNGFTHASGIYFAGAQGCTVEDVRIDATNGYSGFLKTIGVNGGYYNVEVQGGEYGMYMKQHTSNGSYVSDVFPTFAGCRFYDQKKRVIWTNGRSPTTFVGFHIKKWNGPVFESLNNSHEAGGSLTLMDGVIELTNPSTSVAIDNDLSNQSRSVYMKDVYVKNAATIITNARPYGSVAGTSGGWTKVAEYGRAFIGGSWTKPGRNLINGVQSAPEISTNVINRYYPSSSVPTADSLVSNHVWDEATFPSFSDSDTYDAVVDGGLNKWWSSDVTWKLNDILQNHNKVFLPKGLYKISGTIRIPGNTKLFGISKTNVILRPDYGNWPGAWGNTEMYIVETDNNKDASPLLSNVWIDYTRANPGKMLSPVHWKAGRGSMIRDIFFYDKKWVSGVNGSGFVGLNKKLIKFSGNAGGRMYGLTTGWQQAGYSSSHDDMRVIYVQGTREPLNFYGFNVERQLGKYQSEFNNAHNVAVFGGKTEGGNPRASIIPRSAYRPMLGITNNCNNIIVATAASSSSGCKEGWIQVVDSNNVLCANITSQVHNGYYNLIWENRGGVINKINAGNYSTTHYQRGTTTLMDFGTSGAPPPPPPPPPTQTNPILSPIADVTMNAGSTAVANLSATDADGDPITLSATGVPAFGTLTDNGNGTGTISFSPGSSDTGTYAITVKAEDSRGGYNYKPFDVTVNASANNKPILSPIDDVIMNENTTAVASISASDADGDPITLSATGVPAFGTLTDNGDGTGTISFSPGSSDTGTYAITVKAEDDQGAVHYKPFDVTVNGVAYSPVLSPIADVSMNEDQTAVVNLSATDANGDSITLTAIGLPTFGMLTDNGDGTGTIRFSPGYTDSGSFSITVRADDGNGGLNHKPFTLTVIDINRSPFITVAPDDVTVDENAIATVSITAADFDNDPITFSATGIPAFGALTDSGDGTGVVTLSPGYNDAGVYMATLSADDGRGGIHYKSLTITVNNINRQPSISTIVDLSVEEECIHVINIAATDVDANDVLRLSVSGLPSFCSLTDNGDGTGIIVLNPVTGDANTYADITVTVNDGNTASNTDSTMFNLTVEEASVLVVAYSNDFSDPASQGNDFTSSTSSFQISNGELSAIGDGLTGYKTTFLNTTLVPENTDDFKIVSRMKKGTAASYHGAAIRFRHADWQNYSELQISSNSGSDLRVYTKSGGSTVSPIDSWDVDMDPEAYNTYSLIVSGTNADVYVNNALVGSSTVGSIGRVGLTARKDVSIWDYFRVISDGEPDYLEDFDDSLAQDWSYNASKFELSDTGGGDFVLKQTAGSSYSTATYNAVVSVDANYSVSVDGRATGSRANSWDSPSLVIKYKSSNDLFSTFINQDTVSGNGTLILKKVIGGVKTVVELASLGVSVDVTDWHTIEAQVNGTSLSISVNGTEVVSSYTDADLAAPVFDSSSECGVFTPSSSVSVEFDNLRFYDEYQ